VASHDSVSTGTCIQNNKEERTEAIQLTNYYGKIAMNDEREQTTSSSPAIAKPPTPNSCTISTESMTFEGRVEIPGSLYPTNRLEKFWTTVVVRWEVLATEFYKTEFWTRWTMFRTGMYKAIVGAIAGFLADILAHPKLMDCLVSITVAAINSFMEQDDIGAKFDSTARNVIYDPEKARETSKALGKEVVPMVTSFVGGVASSLKPSAIMHRKKKQRESKKLQDSEGNALPDNDSSTQVSEITLSERLDHHPPIIEEYDEDTSEGNDDSHDSNVRSWFSSVKKQN